MIFFLLGIVLYSSVPTLGHIGSIPLFVAAFCIILSMYRRRLRHHPGPTLRDMFGTYQVGAIHGRLLTAWSVRAGGVGPRAGVITFDSSRSTAGSEGTGLLDHHVQLCAALLLNRIPVQFRDACGRQKFQLPGALHEKQAC